MGVRKGAPRNPRHEAKLTAERVVNSNRGQVEVSDRVLARRLIDALEPMIKAAYEQGCADGQEGSDQNFDRWYLNRDRGVDTPYFEGAGEEFYAEPQLGDHGTCGWVGDDWNGCRRELTFVVVGPGPVIDGQVIGKAVDWVHSYAAQLVSEGRGGLVGEELVVSKERDYQQFGHYAQLGGPA